MYYKHYTDAMPDPSEDGEEYDWNDYMENKIGSKSFFKRKWRRNIRHNVKLFLHNFDGERIWGI